MANKGLLRQAYVKFYNEEAKQIIDEFNNPQSMSTDAQLAGMKARHNNHMRHITIVFIVSILLFFSGLISIGIIGIILFAYLLISAPKYVKIAAEKNKNKQTSYKSVKDINIAKIFDGEASLKEQLMQKFLTLFGDFKWQKWKSYINTSDLIILPDKLSLDADDCIMGKYENTSIKMTEVLFGWKSMIAAFGNHLLKLQLLNFILPVFFFVVFFIVAEKIQGILFFGLIVFFLFVWGMNFFLIPIMFATYLKNQNNRGLIVEIDMPKSFKGETVLFENALTNLTVDKKALKRFEKTQLEDTEFNKKYSIYTNNQIEARYVLTTAFIERLKNIKFKFEARYLRMRFKNNRITIFASTRQDLFQMVKSGVKTDMKTFDVLFEEIYSVLSLVDELKLNVKTGL